MTAPDSFLPVPALIRTITRETEDTFTLEVHPERQSSFDAFEPGQFSMIYVYGVAELPISISGDPAKTNALTYTVRGVGKATNALVNSTRDDWVGIRGPFGRGWPMKAAQGKDVVIVAGGIGLAPLRPAIYHMLAHREQYGRITLLYGARSPRDLLFRKELQSWRKSPQTQFLTTVDYGGVSYRGHVGVVTTLFRRLRLDPAKTIAFACGPEIMLRYVTMDLEARGLSQDDIYISMERNMKCGTGLCGHCQFGSAFVCKDGPVFPFRAVSKWIHKYEV
jgi:NAD(P)H-flavin reductase